MEHEAKSIDLGQFIEGFEDGKKSQDDRDWEFSRHR